MIDQIVLVEMKQLVPEGQRSDFVNNILHSALIEYGRRKAMEKINEFQKSEKITMTTEEIIKAKNYGRE